MSLTTNSIDLDSTLMSSFNFHTHLNGQDSTTCATTGPATGIILTADVIAAVKGVCCRQNLQRAQICGKRCLFALSGPRPYSSVLIRIHHIANPQIHERPIGNEPLKRLTSHISMENMSVVCLTAE
jgi:hypothetical protein